MKIRTSAAAFAAAGALGLALVPSVAVAHDGDHPFENCSAAYDAGYSNIRQGDEHYGKHLDRDADGVGCDQPPADFVPVKDSADDSGKDEDSGKPAKQDGDGLAETGGDDSTPYIAAAGGLVLVAGAGVLVATRSRRSAG
jgi:LPXTG-motif cell wall-anchored protein